MAGGCKERDPANLDAAGGGRQPAPSRGVGDAAPRADQRPEAEDPSQPIWDDCPPGTLRQGRPPPKGTQLYCVLQEEGGRAVKHGTYRRWDRSGQLLIEGDYVRGKRDGRWRQWYPDGRIKEESSYREDIFDGPWSKYYESGQIQGEGAYANGKKDGLARFWYESGQLKASGTYEDDLRVGESTNWYEDGKVKSTGRYVAGNKDGDWVDFAPDGSETRSRWQAGARIQ